MTLSWPRLTWPALAVRQAAPWSRKMSATSRAGRGMSAGALCRRLAWLHPYRREPIERAHDHADGVGSDPRIGWIQAVVATQSLLAARSNWSSASAGVLQSSVFRGLALRAIATAVRSSALCTLRSVPFGKYWRSSPLVFSFVPRCQGLWGSQK